MAGYLFTFSDEKSLLEAMRRGSYTTLMNVRWGPAALSTLGDYATMRPGDSVYFFSSRMVYGIGSIVQVVPGHTVLENYEGSTGTTLASPSDLPSDALMGTRTEDRVGRWVIAFEPDPCMFGTGIDMDDLLASNPRAFRSLRVFWKRSFIKLDDEEDMAFRTAILRRNAAVLRDPSGMGTMEIEYTSEHAHLRAAAIGRSLAPDIQSLVGKTRLGDGRAKTEMMLEVALLHQLSEHDAATERVFGKWDYLSHQVHASPAKAVDYMDKIDVFGYRWIEGYRPIVEKYLVVELKQGTVVGSDLQQVMKYVDWVRGEYANGDYSLVGAFLVGHDFDMVSINEALPTVERYSLSGYRPPIPYRWADITMARYSIEADGHVSFHIVRQGT